MAGVVLDHQGDSPDRLNTVEAYIQFKPGLITPDGEVADKGTAEFLRKYMSELHAFIVRVLTVLPRES